MVHNTMPMKTIIMDHVRIERTLHRIALQVLENCYQEKQITLVGIEPRGMWVADQLHKNIEELSSMKLERITIDAENINNLDQLQALVKGKTVVLVDDVLKSGHTMMKAASALMNLEPKALLTACLVDRKHRRYPIHSDFTGLSLATTIQEHIQLIVSDSPLIYLE